MASLAARYDQVSATISYSGMANPGSLTSNPVWRIRKIEASGSDVVVTFANGSDAFNQIWDNRLILSYS